MAKTAPQGMAAKIAAAWELGRLEWKLDPNQEGMYRFFLDNVKKARKHVWNCSRQLGKSYLLCSIAIEQAIQKPGASIKYAAQTSKQVRSIIRPHFRDITIDCPEHLRPVFHSQDGEWRFPNGSIITVAGCDGENAERLRGQHAHLAIVDEAGAIDSLEWVVQDILLPQTLNTGGRILIVSTPAKTAAHPFKAFCAQAEDRGTYLHRTIYDNPRITEEDIEDLKREAGGEESTTWQREYLCRHVTDQDRAVLKNATEWFVAKATMKLQSDEDFSYRPSNFDTYVGMDVGWSPDFTGIVFGYWDYEQATLVIEDEVLMRQMDTKLLAMVIKAKERELWGYMPQRMHQRWSDLDGRLHSDLANDHDLLFVPTPKDDKDAAINRVNLMLSGQKYKLRLHPRVRILKRQMKDCIWNKQRTKYERSKLDGHYDLVDALIYLARNVQYDKPPDGSIVTHGRNSFVIPMEDAQDSRIVRALKAVLGLEA